MKIVPVGFATAIVLLSGLSAGFAQERLGSSDRSQYGARQDGRGQATEEQSERGNDRPRFHRDLNVTRAGSVNNVQSSEGQIAQGSEGQIARFRFARGNSRFDIQCPASEQMRECLQAAALFIRQMSQPPDLIEKGADKAPTPEFNNSGSKQQ